MLRTGLRALLAVVCVFLATMGAEAVDLRLLSADIDSPGYPHMRAQVFVDSAHGNQCLLRDSHFTVREADTQQVIESVSCAQGSAVAVDIVVAFDTTGSMGEEIAGMRVRATEFASSIRNAGIDARFGLVTIDDVPEFILDLTTDIDAFQTKVNRFVPHGGGDLPEGSLDAVVMALTSMHFRENALKVFLVITDAPSHYRGDGSGIGGYTMEEVANLLGNQLGTAFVVSPSPTGFKTVKANDGTQVVRPKSTETDRIGDMAQLARATGGRWIDIHGTEDFTAIIDQIAQTIRSIYTIRWQSSLGPEAPGGQRAVCVSVNDPVQGTGSGCTEYLAPPGNDDFANRIELTMSHPLNHVLATNRGATAEPGEPLHAGAAGGRSLWWSWTAPRAGKYIFQTGQVDGPDTLLAIYRGDEVDALTEVTSNDDYPGLYAIASKKSLVVLPAQAGDRFAIAVDGKAGAQGTVYLWYYDLTYDDIASPRDLEGAEGRFEMLNFGATNEPGESTVGLVYPKHSLWLRWTAPHTGGEEILFGGMTVLQPFSPSQVVGAVYTGNSFATLTPVGEVMNYRTRFPTTAGTSYLIQLGSPSTNYTVITMHWYPRPTNDYFGEGDLINTAKGAVTAGNRGATVQPNEPSHGGVAPEHSTWHRYGGSWETGVMTFAIKAEEMNPTLAVYSGYYYDALTPAGSSVAPEGSWLREAAVMVPVSETNYQIAVDSHSATGAYEFSWRLDKPNGTDDSLEDNDREVQAKELAGAGTQLEALVHKDDDWFFANVEPGYSLRAAIFFAPEKGNLDLGFYRREPVGTPAPLGSSATANSPELLSYTNSSSAAETVLVAVTGGTNELYRLSYQLDAPPTPTPTPSPSPTATTTPTMTLTPTARPSPTPTWTTYPSPTAPPPSPTATPIHRVDFAFSPDDQTSGSVRAWTFLPQSRATGAYDAEHTALTIRTETNAGSFGVWRSPVFEITGSPTAATRRAVTIQGTTGTQSLYRSTWTVSSDVETTDSVPTVRLRSSSFDWQQTDELGIASRAVAALSPRAARTFRQYFTQPANQQEFRLNFDVLNFDPSDVEVAVVSLEAVTVEYLDQSTLGAASPVARFDFRGSTEGFTPRRADSPLVEPVSFAGSDEGIAIRGADGAVAGTVFGYFGKLTDLRFERYKLYRLTWTVASDATAENRLNVPTFRLRVNDGSLQLGALVQINSFQASARVPVAGNFESYQQWIEAEPAIVGHRMALSFDYLAAAELGDDPTVMLTLQKIEIETFARP